MHSLDRGRINIDQRFKIMKIFRVCTTVHVCHKSVHVSISEVCVLEVIIEVVGVGVVSSQLSGLV